MLQIPLTREQFFFPALQLFASSLFVPICVKINGSYEW